jgi:hydantoinase/carbamoylase family amidase
MTETSVQCFLDLAGTDRDPIQPARFAALVEDFGRIGGTADGGVTRRAFSDEDVIAREKALGIMQQELGLSVRIDAWGNIFGRRPGRRPELPALLTGSHLDSVPNGGRFDGPAGVLCGLEAIRALDRLDIQTDRPLEVAVFTAEEPNAFGLSTIGSQGITGALTTEDLHARRDDRGTTLAEALRRIGGDPDHLESARLKPGRVEAFLEVHIEQMSHLESAGKEIGIVEGIAGIHRLGIEITGRADHAGTTPMDRRRDALAAAAEVITAVRRLALAAGDRAVATVGRIHVEPNAVNVVPACVELDLEVRSYHPEETQVIVAGLKRKCAGIESTTHVKIDMEDPTYYTEPLRFSDRLCQTVAEACRRLNYPAMSSISMAGHDAYHLARVADTSMIFVPCKEGVSHHPAEWTDPEALAKAARVLALTWLLLDRDSRGRS